MKTRTVLIAVIIVAGCLSAQASVISNVADDFSIANGNPNGAWTYGKYTGGVDSSTFVAYDTSGTNIGIAAGLQWWRSGSASDPCATYNPTSATITDDDDAGAHAWGDIAWAPGAFAVSPANGPSVARWTASTAGIVDWTATFSGIQAANTPCAVYVIHNSAILSSTSPVEYNSPATLSGAGLAVAIGDRIDFVVSGDKLTQVDAVIECAVPEPSTILLMGTGLFGLIAYAWRTRRCAQ
jgi:hypothetical protein